MTWVKLDDLFPGHLKVLRAGPSAAWLFVAGLCYCAQYLTDGFIPDEALPGLGQYGALRAKHLAGVLVGVSLWERRDGGYYIHDYLNYQPSRKDTEQQREAKRRAGQAGGQASALARGQALARPTVQPPSPTRPQPLPQPRPSEGAADAAPNIFRLYEQTIGPFDPHMATKLDEAEKEYSQECIQHSFAEASENNARSWRYVETILKSHKRDGCYAGRRQSSDPVTLEHDEIHRRHELAGKRCPFCYVPEEEPTEVGE